MLSLEQELIDTLWNVNKNSSFIKNRIKSELIDTLWNVNHNKIGKSYAAHYGINRYIMECKSIAVLATFPTALKN